MLRYYLLLTLAFSYVTTSKVWDYPALDACRPSIISAIRAHWAIVGTPRDVMKQLQENYNSSVHMTSYDYKNDDSKCVYATAVGKYLNATFISKNGVTPEVVLPYEAEEGSDGVLKGRPLYSDAPEHRWNWYTLFFKNGVGAYYVCSDLEGSTLPPTAVIVVKQKPTLAGTLSTVINPLVVFFQGLGFNFKHIYDEECLSGTTASPLGGVSSGLRGILSG